MAPKFINDLIKELGENKTVTIKQLVKIGLFGTAASARQAVRSGRIPHIAISPRRRLITREHVIQFIKDNFRAKSGNADNFSVGCKNNDSTT